MPGLMTSFAKQWGARRGLKGRGCRALAAALALPALFGDVAGAGVPDDLLRQAALREPGMPRLAAPLRAGDRAPMPAVPVRREERRESVREGEEGLTLAARLRADGGLIRRPVRWRIYRLSPGEAMKEPDVVLRRPRARLSLPPGEWGIEATYGLRRAWHVAHVRPRQRLHLVFIMDVGGLRMLSTVQGAPATDAGPVEHRILRILPGGGEREVAVSRVPGEILRLPAGEYMVESVFLRGNVKARARVRVKPGRLYSLQISARAAVVRVRARKGENWLLAERNGEWRWRGEGPQKLVLAPGSYVWEVAGRRRELQIVPGETRLAP